MFVLMSQFIRALFSFHIDVVGIISLRENRIWSFRHNYFNFDPIRGDFDVAGVQYQWNDGIFSLTLGNRMPDGFRTAYFHSMARYL